MTAAGVPPSNTTATTIARKLPDTWTRDERMRIAIWSLATAKTRRIPAVSRSQLPLGAVSAATARAAASRPAVRTCAKVEGERRIRKEIVPLLCRKNAQELERCTRKGEPKLA